MAKISIVSGNLMEQEVEAIVTCVNSEKMWFGGIDRAIFGVAGGFYHSQIDDENLFDGNVYFASGDRLEHNGNFNHVVFIIDDLKRPTAELVKLALEKIKEQNLEKVAFAALRTGVMRDAVEPVADTVSQLVSSLKECEENIDFSIVVYHDPEILDLFEKELA